MKKGIVLLGSANSHGNTRTIVDYLISKTGFDLLDLKQKHILEFDYEFKNRADDFYPSIKNIVENYDQIIFATPVYWYSMSGLMKTFFDRLSDCLKIYKDTGRKLRGMDMAVMSCANDEELVKGFYMPFEESAKYLGMHYIASVHGYLDEGTIPPTVKDLLDDFSTQLTSF